MNSEDQKTPKSMCHTTRAGHSLHLKVTITLPRYIGKSSNEYVTSLLRPKVTVTFLVTRYFHIEVLVTFLVTRYIKSLHRYFCSL